MEKNGNTFHNLSLQGVSEKEFEAIDKILRDNLMGLYINKVAQGNPLRMFGENIYPTRDFKLSKYLYEDEDSFDLAGFLSNYPKGTFTASVDDEDNIWIIMKDGNSGRVASVIDGAIIPLGLKEEEKQKIQFADWLEYHYEKGDVTKVEHHPILVEYDEDEVFLPHSIRLNFHDGETRRRYNIHRMLFHHLTDGDTTVPGKDGLHPSEMYTCNLTDDMRISVFLDKDDPDKILKVTVSFRESPISVVIYKEVAKIPYKDDFDCAMWISDDDITQVIYK